MRTIFLFLILELSLFGAPQLRAAEPIFPKSMEFSVHRGIAGGTFDVQFSEVRGSDQYKIVLRNFGGFGITSDQELWSYLRKDDLSLVGHMLTENGQRSDWLREIRLDPDCQSALGRGKTQCFKYKEKGDKTPIQTEIYAPYPAIDLVSSLVVAARAAATQKPEKSLFNFIFNRATKQVSLNQIGEETLSTPLGKKKVKIFSLVLVNSSTELYRFYIAQDENGYYPAKIDFTEENQKTTELIATKVLW